MRNKLSIFAMVLLITFCGCATLEMAPGVTDDQVAARIAADGIDVDKAPPRLPELGEVPEPDPIYPTVEQVVSWMIFYGIGGTHD